MRSIAVIGAGAGGAAAVAENRPGAGGALGTDMVAKAAERMDGAPVQRLSVAGVNPDDMTDAELAAIAAGRGGAPHSAEGDQD